MKTQLLSLSKIFTERILRIPDYQRGYAWSEKELRDFWNDLVQLEDNKNHYTGVLTLEDVTEQITKQWHDDIWVINSKNYAPYYVVDGQQRLTTAIILVQAIIEYVPQNQKLNFTPIEEIQKKFIFETKDEGISRSYLFGYEKDNPSYEFLKTKIFKEKSDSSLPIQETIYTHNLEFAKKFFTDNLTEMTFEQVEKLYKKLTQQFLFNIYAISEDVDVFVAFETMNNRGKPLSYLELLKNRLIYITTKFKSDEYEKQTLRNAINESWKSVYHYLGRNKEKIYGDDVFLNHHFSLYFSDFIEQNGRFLRTYRQEPYFVAAREAGAGEVLLEKIFTPKNISGINPNVDQQNELTISKIFNYVRSLKDSIETWYYILNPRSSNYSDKEILWLEKFTRLPNSALLTIAPMIMLFYQKEKEELRRISFLKSLERLMFVTMSARFSYMIDFDQSRLSQEIRKLGKGEISTNELITWMDESADKILDQPEFLERMIAAMKNNSGFYRWFGIKYFMYEYELSLKIKAKNYREKLIWEKFSDNDFGEFLLFEEDKRDYHTIEHIYPQNPRKLCWTEKYKKYSDKEKRLLRNSLGNLVPLSEPKNNALENDCFEDKKGKNGSLVGFKYGSLSENELATYEDWTAKEILERGIKLLEFWEKRWNFKIGDKKDKAKFLHIEFVIEKEKIQID